MVLAFGAIGEQPGGLAGGNDRAARIMRQQSKTRPGARLRCFRVHRELQKMMSRGANLLKWKSSQPNALLTRGSWGGRRAPIGFLPDIGLAPWQPSPPPLLQCWLIATR